MKIFLHIALPQDISGNVSTDEHLVAHLPV